MHLAHILTIMATQKIIPIAGASQHLGLAIVRAAVTRDPSVPCLRVCHDGDAGTRAIDDLRESSVTASLKLLRVDVTKDTEIAKTVKDFTTR